MIKNQIFQQFYKIMISNKTLKYLEIIIDDIIIN